ncbi:MAG: glycosyl transferase [Anaerolineae bacterium]|nr:glycosyl transferase [Anaerolineae bacterium]
MAYGYFDSDHREYVITDPRTPVKWINYIGTLAFGGYVDHTGGAALCKGDPALNRITWYVPQRPVSDFQGTTLYLRLIDEDGYTVFSPFFVPTLDRYDLYECHVGLGYNRIISEMHGVRTEATIFVPVGGSQELRDIRITNTSGAPLTLDAIPVVDYSHPEAIKQFNNNDWVPQTMVSRVVDEPDDRRILCQYPFMFRDIRQNYLTSSLPVGSFESDRDAFLGYGGWAAPEALQRRELANYEALRGQNIGALLHHLGTLQPGETRRLITQLGQAPNIATALPEIHAYRDGDLVDDALARLERNWTAYLDRMQVETPDAAMNAMLNIHNPRQCYITLNWSRYLSIYQTGLGTRGIGMRDSSQDVMGVVCNAPEEARALMTQLLQVQRKDGSGMHQFYPLTMEASIGDAAEGQDRPSYYGDDHLWLVLAVTAYLKETGDFALLDEVLPYYDRDAHGNPQSTGTVLNHLQRAIAFSWLNTGAHGIPLLGFADWNDTMNLRKGAESLFNANLLGAALQDMIELLTYLGKDKMVVAFAEQYRTMRERVNAVAWDGDIGGGNWYVRYFDSDGAPLGSACNDKGRIYLNAQSWAVMSGFATAERAIAALDAAHTHLNTRNGLKTATPGYDGFDPNKGGMTTYPPGTKENCGIFLHTNPWAMIAETMVGRGDRAFGYYAQINPAARNDRIDEFEVEPYVYCQNILSDEHPQFGLGRNSWLTGTASWAYQAGTQYILGIRPTYGGLTIDPCIPSAWDGFHAVRRYRGATYDITVTNPDHVSKGIRSVTVDGTPIAGAIVPAFGDGTRHRIEVEMG